MKRAGLYFVSCLFIPALLGGCLNTGGVRMSIDLKKARGEIIYLNIVSAGEEGVARADFRDLLGMVYGKDEALETAFTTISKELYAEGGRLNGRTEFLINDAEELLGEFEIRRGPAGGYYMEVRDGDVTYAGGNGFLIEDASGPRIVWEERTPVIEAELRYDQSGKEAASLLPYWREWKEWDSIDTPDALKLLAEQLGEAIEPDPEVNTIDYCPDSTCLSFSAGLRTEGSLKRLADFAYIYLYHVADDATLEGFKSSEKEHVQEIVLVNMRECAYVNENENARCALRVLAHTYSIKVAAIAYGEEDSQEKPIDLEEELKRLGECILPAAPYHFLNTKNTAATMNANPTA